MNRNGIISQKKHIMNKEFAKQSVTHKHSVKSNSILYLQIDLNNH